MIVFACEWASFDKFPALHCIAVLPTFCIADVLERDCLVKKLI